MTTINELKKKYNIKKDELLTGMDEDELKRTILKLTKTYYVSYFNNDKKQYTSTLNMLEFIAAAYSDVTIHRDYYNNIPNFINYCMLLSMNMVLTDLFERDFTLKEPYFTDLSERRYHDLSSAFKPETVELIEEICDRERIIKPDADLDDIKNAMPYLELILTSTGKEVFNEVIHRKEESKAIEDDKKYGWR